MIIVYSMRTRAFCARAIGPKLGMKLGMKFNFIVEIIFENLLSTISQSNNLKKFINFNI